MTERKLCKKKHITVVQSELCERTASAMRNGGPIHSLYQYFTYRVKHKKGSTRPAGTFHSLWGGSDQTVEVRWLHTDDLGYFGPELTFQPTTDSMKLVQKVAKALMCIRHTDNEGPEGLVEYLKAYVVEYITDNKKGCWDDYRVLQAPGDCAMMTIARYAS